MQIDTTSVLGAAAGAVSRRDSVASPRIKADPQEWDRLASGSGDTVQTRASDLVSQFLRSQDAASEARLARLQQAYESGNYMPKTHEVARAIIAGVLVGD